MPFGFMISAKTGQSSQKNQKKSDFYLAFYHNKVYTNLVMIIWGGNKPLDDFCSFCIFRLRGSSGSVSFSIGF